MSGLAAADRIQSTEECQTQEGRHASEATGLNTGVNAAEGMYLSSRELISDAVWRRSNKYALYDSEKTPLDTAVQACNVKSLDIFLDCVDLDEQVKTRMISNAYTNFFRCEFSQITKDHVAVVKRLLELGADVNGGRSVFPLSVAAKAGSYPLVELLCQNGADLKKTAWKVRLGKVPLIITKVDGYYDLFELMSQFLGRVHDNIFCYSSVDLAFIHGHIDCAKCLLQHGGANFDLDSVFYSLIRHQSVAYMNLLLVYCRPEAQQFISKHQRGLLSSAVKRTNIEFISHFLDIVFDITGEYPCLEELLGESGNGEIASFLIRKGADVNKPVQTCGGYTSLYLAIDRKVDIQVIKVLLENGACPNFHGDTSPLMFAASTEDSTDLLQLLLDYGADINWRDSEGDTAFFYSVCQGCDSNAEFLIRCAKDNHFINSQNNEGLTVLMQAARYRNVAVVKEVINLNPDMNMTDNNGNTALLHAINETNFYNNWNVDIVTTLINAGCDVNLQNDDGLSPLMLAASKYCKRVVQILLDAGADINAVSKTDRTKTALSYFQLMNINNKDLTACIAIFLAQGACLSYLQPKMFHRILLCNDSDTIRKFITFGTGPITVRSDEYFNYFSPADPTFDISPLSTALMSGNASLARHFVDIMWLTKSDLTSLMHNKPVRSYLEKKNHTQCLNLLDEMSSQPMSLFRLAFVEVSSAVGTAPGRENRINKLPLPRLLKDKLLFKSAIDFIIPTIDMIPFSPLLFDLSPKIYISVLDCCKCCRVWQNFKLKFQYRNVIACNACIKNSCSECFNFPFEIQYLKRLPPSISHT